MTDVSDRLKLARKMQALGQGLSGAASMVEAADHVMDKTQVVGGDGPAGLGIITRLRKRIGR